MESDSDEILSMRGDEEYVDDKKQQEQHKKNNFECDLSAYVLFQEGHTGAPCLSFDVLRDDLGDNRNCDTELTCYIVSGSQAPRVHLNNIQVAKISRMRKVQNKDESDDDDDDDDDDDSDSDRDHDHDHKEETTVISSASVAQKGCINRIKATHYNDATIAAAWSEMGSVSIWDLRPFLEAVEDPSLLRQFKAAPPSPLFTQSNDGVEGFALDWSSTTPGMLAVGDCNRFISVWQPEEGGRWGVSSEPYSAHSKSVEDIQWSPTERHVFASCSCDQSIRIWDNRAVPTKACMLVCENAHDGDINAIHWNRQEPFIASGGDDSKVRIWDLRKFETKTPVALLQYHGAPVCSVEWHPSDSSVLATAGEDDCVLQWDLAVERDEEQANKNINKNLSKTKQKKEKKEKRSLPQQLLFVHKGQEEVKEIHWHPQVPGLMLSTAHSGVNIFKTISC